MERKKDQPSQIQPPFTKSKTALLNRDQDDRGPPAIVSAPAQRRQETVELDRRRTTFHQLQPRNETQNAEIEQIQPSLIEEVKEEDISSLRNQLVSLHQDEIVEEEEEDQIRLDENTIRSVRSNEPLIFKTSEKQKQNAEIDPIVLEQEEMILKHLMADSVKIEQQYQIFEDEPKNRDMDRILKDMDISDLGMTPQTEILEYIQQINHLNIYGSKRASFEI